MKVNDVTKNPGCRDEVGHHFHGIKPAEKSDGESGVSHSGHCGRRCDADLGQREPGRNDHGDAR